MRLLLLMVLASGTAAAQDREIQRALIQRDQQSAEFARRGLENLHSDQLRDAGRPLSPDPAIARELLPYERQNMAREREAAKSREQPPPAPSYYPPLPLPGSSGAPQVVEPVAGPSVGG